MINNNIVSKKFNLNKINYYFFQFLVIFEKKKNIVKKNSYLIKL